MKNKNTIKTGSFVYIVSEGLNSLYTVEKINRKTKEASIYHPILNTRFVDLQDLDLVPETF
jgi:hypothetical protein